MALTSFSSRRDRGETISATRARQGMWGRHVLWVLIISFTLAAIALFASWAMRANDLRSAEDPGAERTEARMFDAPLSQPVTPPAPAR